MRGAVSELAADADWVVLAGSVPPGTPDGWYAEVAAALSASGAQVAVDTSDKPLLALAAALGQARPDIIKPNSEELALLTGGDADAIERDPAAAAAAAYRLVEAGAGAVLATLGGAGAVLVTPEGAWRATPPPITVVSTVGAGDSSLFGYLLADLRGEEPGRAAAPRRRLRQRRGLAARHHDPRTPPGAAGPRRGPPRPAGHPSGSCVHSDPCVARSPRNTSSHRCTERTEVTAMSTPLIDRALVRLDDDLGDDKSAVIRSLAEVVAAAGRSGNASGLTDDALARESTSPTGLPGGIAIPHCRTAHVEVPTLAFARLNPPRDFGAKDGPADLAFLIAAPAGGDATHLQLLTKLARALVKKDFTDALRNAATEDEVVELVAGVVGTAPAPAAAGAAPAATPTAGATAAAAAPAASAADTTSASSSAPQLVAITACPTGIAHTYMAAEALEAAAGRAGVDISVETQGSAGSTPLSQATIAGADAVIFATDVGVKDRARFAGKPMVASGVKRAIDDSDGMIRDAVAAASNPSASRVEGTAADGAAGAPTRATSPSG